jgi:hypothetical protein
MESALLSEPQIVDSVSKSEAGMGFQVAHLNKREGYIVSSKVFVPITTTQRGQAMEPEYYTKDLAVHAPQPKYMATGSLDVRPKMGRYYVFGLRRGRLPGASAAGSEHPENETRTTATDHFYRVTAYLDDKRIRPDRSLAPE